MSMVSVENVSKVFGTREVLKNVSFEVAEKEIVALVGPSGSGKSTILNMIGLLDTIDSGKIFIRGEKLPQLNTRAAVSYRRNVINYLFQSHALISTSNVAENLMLALTFTDLSKNEKIKRIQEVVRFVDLEKHLQSKVHELSGGEQQRVAIARTILKPGDLILADEPTGSLDPKLAQQSFERIKDLRDCFGKTILMVTHNMEQAMQCDRVISMVRED